MEHMRAFHGHRGRQIWEIIADTIILSLRNERPHTHPFVSKRTTRFQPLTEDFFRERQNERLTALF